jgi:flagellar biosynthesis protein FlhB
MSERTEAPTPRRLRKAREEGDSGASGYAAQAVAFVVAIALVPALAGAVASRASVALSAAIARAAHPGALDALDALDAFDRVATVGVLVLPLLFTVAAASVIAHVVQTGGVVSAGRVAPRLARLDPLAGLRALLSPARAWSVARALVAGALVGWLAYGGLADHVVDLARVSGHPARTGEVAGALARALAWKVALVGLAFGAVDVVVARRAWLARLRMTPAEIKREHRDSEGDPQLKAARARAHQELLAQATLASVRQASVVVVNPTHLACALRYDESGGDEAPVVVASGEGELAARIVQAAREAGVPVVRDVPLARALVELEIGAAIPEALYQAVAEILREVWEDEAR